MSQPNNAPNKGENSGGMQMQVIAYISATFQANFFFFSIISSWNTPFPLLFFVPRSFRALFAFFLTMTRISGHGWVPVRKLQIAACWTKFSPNLRDATGCRYSHSLGLGHGCGLSTSCNAFEYLRIPWNTFGELSTRGTPLEWTLSLSYRGRHHPGTMGTVIWGTFDSNTLRRL